MKNYNQKLLNGNIYYLFIDIKELNKSNKKIILELNEKNIINQNYQFNTKQKGK